jgi:hypothetical protein
VEVHPPRVTANVLEGGPVSKIAVGALLAGAKEIRSHAREESLEAPGVGALSLAVGHRHRSPRGLEVAGGSTLVHPRSCILTERAAWRIGLTAVTERRPPSSAVVTTRLEKCQQSWRRFDGSLEISRPCGAKQRPTPCCTYARRTVCESPIA